MNKVTTDKTLQSTFINNEKELTFVDDEQTNLIINENVRIKDSIRFI